MIYNIDIYGMPNGKAVDKLMSELSQINFNSETNVYVKVDKAGNAIQKAVETLQYNKYIFQISNDKILINGKA
tara:strand:+ start:1444 stop:1662 length:219 start_codon:yes stop_codon:yes gene_type:complete